MRPLILLVVVMAGGCAEPVMEARDGARQRRDGGEVIVVRETRVFPGKDRPSGLDQAPIVVFRPAADVRITSPSSYGTPAGNALAVERLADPDATTEALGNGRGREEQGLVASFFWASNVGTTTERLAGAFVAYPGSGTHEAVASLGVFDETAPCGPTAEMDPAYGPDVGLGGGLALRGATVYAGGTLASRPALFSVNGGEATPAVVEHPLGSGRSDVGEIVQLEAGAGAMGEFVFAAGARPAGTAFLARFSAVDQVWDDTFGILDVEVPGCEQTRIVDIYPETAATGRVVVGGMAECGGVEQGWSAVFLPGVGVGAAGYALIGEQVLAVAGQGTRVLVASFSESSPFGDAVVLREVSPFGLSVGFAGGSGPPLRGRSGVDLMPSASGGWWVAGSTDDHRIGLFEAVGGDVANQAGTLAEAQPGALEHVALVGLVGRTVVSTRATDGSQTAAVVFEGGSATVSSLDPSAFVAGEGSRVVLLRDDDSVACVAHLDGDLVAHTPDVLVPGESRAFPFPDPGYLSAPYPASARVGVTLVGRPSADASYRLFTDEILGLVSYQDYPLVAECAACSPTDDPTHPCYTCGLVDEEVWFRSGNHRNGDGNHTFNPEQSYAYDIVALRWDGAKFTEMRAENEGHPNDAYLVQGMPIYASHAGDVRKITVGAPPNDPTDTPRDKVWRDNPDAPGCGNGVLVDNDDGSTTSYCHMDRTAWDQLVPLDGCEELGGCEVELPPGTIRIGRNDWIGFVGNTGASTAPHLHVHTERDGLGIPTRFRATIGTAGGECSVATPTEGCAFHVLWTELGLPPSVEGITPWWTVDDSVEWVTQGTSPGLWEWP